MDTLEALRLYVSIAETGRESEAGSDDGSFEIHGGCSP
jgi:hypothetical protein